MYANHTAYGITVAFIINTCLSYYQGIKEVEKDMNVNVAHAG